MDDLQEVEVHEHAVLRKFAGDVPPDCEDPAAAGFRLLEEIEIEDGVIVRRTVFEDAAD